MRLTVVIPSYWGRPKGEPFNPEDAVYDHPTPLDGEGTLARALESVRMLRHPDFRVVVIGVATHPDLQERVESRVAGIVTPFKQHYPVAFLTHSDERFIRRAMEDEGLSQLADLVDFTGYSNIRNACLIAAAVTGAEAAVLFDDDEVYEDPLYLEKVEEGIGREHHGSFVGGLAGFYVNPDGGYLVKEPQEWIWAEWPAAREMNRAFDIIEGEERFKPTTWVFGGNMVIHRELYARFPFDPHVRRGEDIDYLINCRLFGYRWFLDNRLSIRHLPPPKTAPPWRRFREDIYRFVYTRAKLAARAASPQGGVGETLTPADLDPYPGRFLREDLEEMVFRTSTLMGLECLARGDGQGFEESMRNVWLARYDAPPRFDPWRWYQAYRERWEKFMAWLMESDRLADYISSMLGE
jgi:hypothetical protein